MAIRQSNTPVRARAVSGGADVTATDGDCAES